jgi:hypothetical protein
MNKDGYLRVQIALNDFPMSEWIDCFQEPSTWVDNEAQPKRTDISPYSRNVEFDLTKV